MGYPVASELWRSIYLRGKNGIIEALNEVLIRFAINIHPHAVSLITKMCLDFHAPSYNIVSFTIFSYFVDDAIPNMEKIPDRFLKTSDCRA